MNGVAVSCFTTTNNGMANVLKNEILISNSIIAKSNVLTNKYEGIWDTGATASCITNKIVKECNLLPIGIQKVIAANGEYLTNQYIVDLWLPNKIVIKNLRVTEGSFSGADLLIGMDVMNKGDFAVSNYNGKTIFSFRMPSVSETNYVKLYNSTIPSKKAPKIGANELCPCGTGKKYKKCCGKK